MNFTIKDKTVRVALRREKKRDFAKEREERHAWRHQYPYPLFDYP
jgi:hypothetical protein